MQVECQGGLHCVWEEADGLTGHSCDHDHDEHDDGVGDDDDDGDDGDS